MSSFNKSGKKSLPCYTCGEVGHWAPECPRKELMREAKRVRTELQSQDPLPLDRMPATYLKRAVVGVLTDLFLQAGTWTLNEQKIVGSSIVGGKVHISLEDESNVEFYINYVSASRRSTVCAQDASGKTLYIQINDLQTLNQPIKESEFILFGSNLANSETVTYNLKRTV